MVHDVVMVLTTCLTYMRGVQIIQRLCVVHAENLTLDNMYRGIPVASKSLLGQYESNLYMASAFTTAPCTEIMLEVITPTTERGADGCFECYVCMHKGRLQATHFKTGDVNALRAHAATAEHINHLYVRSIASSSYSSMQCCDACMRLQTVFH